MTPPSRVRLAVAACATMAVALLFPDAAGAARIGFSPAAVVAEPGDVFGVDVVVTELTGEIVGAYDLDIVFDPGVITLDAIALSNALGDPLALEALLDAGSAPGLVDLAGVSLLSDAALLALQGGDAVSLATLTFTKTGDGTTALDFVFDPFNDVKGAGARILDLSVDPGSVGPASGEQPVPEPGAALSFGLGLLVVRQGLRLCRRRDRAGTRSR